jgi:hypothetical protein
MRREYAVGIDPNIKTRHESSSRGDCSSASDPNSQIGFALAELTKGLKRAASQSGHA